MMNSVSTILLPPPCTNNDMHMGHLAGVYIPGDIFARFLALQGHQVFTVCGADQNNTYAELKSKQIGVSFDACKNDYGDKIHASLLAANVRLDAFVYTDTPAHQAAVEAIVKHLTKNGLVECVELPQAYCPDCQCFLSDNEVVGICDNCIGPSDGGVCESCCAPIFNYRLRDAKHRDCGAEVHFKPTQVLALMLERLKPELTRFIEAADWQQPIKKFALDYLSADELGFIPLTNHYQHGNSAGQPQLDAKYLAIWHEAIWCGVTGMLTKEVGEISAAVKQAKHFYSFMGQDTTFYYAIALSAVLMGLGDDPLNHTVCVQKFIKLNGEKFSSSRNHLIYLHDLLKDYDVDVVRLYSLSILKPYQQDANDFVVQDLAELQGELSEFFRGMGGWIDRYTSSLDEQVVIAATTSEAYQSAAQAMQRLEFASVYAQIMRLIKAIDFSLHGPGTACQIMCCLLMLLPVMPESTAVFLDKISHHLNTDLYEILQAHAGK